MNTNDFAQRVIAAIQTMDYDVRISSFSAIEKCLDIIRAEASKVADEGREVDKSPSGEALLDRWIEIGIKEACDKPASCSGDPTINPVCANSALTEQSTVVKESFTTEFDSSQPEACATKDSRAEFEAWIKSPSFRWHKTWFPNRTDDEKYGDGMQECWEAWQAARSAGTEDAKNAQRYLWLRKNDEGIEFRDLSTGAWRADCPSGDELDAAIDQAMSAAPGAQKEGQS